MQRGYKILKYLLVDQGTKICAIFVGKITLIPGFLCIEPWGNGILNFRDLWFIIMLLIILSILTYIYRYEATIGDGLVFVLVGAISNLLDYLIRGFVVDWISILTLPVFNIADIFITFGIVKTILGFLRRKETAQK